jgi:predicted DNA-binding protein YlxM (UPF0122 family)
MIFSSKQKIIDIIKYCATIVLKYKEGKIMVTKKKAAKKKPASKKKK